MRILSERTNRWVSILAIAAVACVLITAGAHAQDATPAFDAEAEVGALRTDSDILWTCVAAFLVFFMQAGFAMVECGFTRAKNAVNIMMKNLMDFAIGSIVFWAIGFGLMFG
ncbi:hypothetical protein K8I31_02370, partial [bacterium]|nr:hypothetical protein [bacterium]